MTNGSNGGRDKHGRFARGNPGGPGNPYARQVGRLRATMINAIQPDDLAEVIETLLEMAKSGNIAASKLLLDRCLGPPIQADILERIEALERQAGSK